MRAQVANLGRVSIRLFAPAGPHFTKKMSGAADAAGGPARRPASADPAALAVEIARLPEQIRGYEQLKHRRAVEAMERGAELLAQQRLAAGIEGESADDRSRPA